MRIRAADNLRHGIHASGRVTFLGFLAENPNEIPVMSESSHDRLEECALVAADDVTGVPDARAVVVEQELNENAVVVHIRHHTGARAAKADIGRITARLAKQAHS